MDLNETEPAPAEPFADAPCDGCKEAKWKWKLEDTETGDPIYLCEACCRETLRDHTN